MPFAAELGKWGIEAQVSQVWFDSAFRDPDEPFGFVASDTESEAVRGRTVATYRVRDGFWIAAGAEAERFVVSNGSNFGESLDGSSQRTWAVFGQTGWERGPLHVDLGSRRDENDVYGGETSLRTGVAVDLGRGTRVRASYGEAFRAPSLGELFFPGSGNPELAPERGEAWELGVEHEAGPWRFSLTGFEAASSTCRLRLRELQERQPRPRPEPGRRGRGGRPARDRRGARSTAPGSMPRTATPAPSCCAGRRRAPISW